MLRKPTEDERTIFFQICDIFLTHLGNRLTKCLHNLAVFRTEFLEIRLDSFNKTTLLVVDNLQLFYIHLIKHYTLDSFNSFSLRGICNRNQKCLKRLTDFQIHFSSQCEHIGSNNLSQTHSLFKSLVYSGSVSFREV